jgi:uncharacterized damage-inducible protein DinB
MKRSIYSLLLLAVIPAGSLVAQDTAMNAIIPSYDQVKRYLLASAEQMPEALYSYRPSDEVRTFGQILGHVAGSQYFFCGAVTGENARAPENFEERTTKAGIIEALNMSFSNCEAAYAIHDAEAMESVDFFGNSRSKLAVLNSNAAHNWEHYGNLVVYFRANGMVPPSSQPSGQ